VAYTPDTVPAQPDWTERTGEGRLGDGPLGGETRSQRALREGTAFHAALEQELRGTEDTEEESWGAQEFERLAGMTGDEIMAEVKADGADEGEG
jgi:hypothetical protein